MSLMVLKLFLLEWAACSLLGGLQEMVGIDLIEVFLLDL